MEVWVRIFNWWGLGNVSTLSIYDIFKSYSPLDSSNNSIILWHVVKWASSYLIWKYRNHKVFRNKVASSPNVLNEIQSTSYEWITRRSKKYKFDWNQWFTNPSFCGYMTAARMVSDNCFQFCFGSVSRIWCLGACYFGLAM
ncbi:uncharacterized protein [Rutidosis leptorrhynchoides]|uniref:uncharacterized protein n=1 Tax=Rutidosis leptorrhynchoides TaxID=125765 RepID=UPI003A99C30C